MLHIGIHLRNDSVKNKGYGTVAKIKALRYAFEKLQCEAVYADGILKNSRSQHVLEKVGFRKTYRMNDFYTTNAKERVWCGRMG